MNFLVIKVIESNDAIQFEHSLAHVEKELLSIIECLVGASESLPRPENTIARAQKMHLWAVPKDDEVVNKATNIIQTIIKDNIEAVGKAIDIYEEFAPMLSEEKKITQYLAGKNNHTREELQTKIDEYQQKIREIREKLPFEIRMNMILVDCYELNRTLVRKCEEIIDKILDKVLEYTHDYATSVINKRENIRTELASQIPEPQRLVELEAFLSEVNNELKGQLIAEYEEVLKWMVMLYANPRLKVQDDDRKPIAQGNILINNIDENIEAAEKNFKEVRDQMEKDVVNDRKEFIRDLEEISTELFEFRTQESVYSCTAYKEQIDVINDKLAEGMDRMANINQREECLTLAVSEFPQLVKLKKEVKPFDELWTMYCMYRDCTEKWKKDPVLTLDPDEVDKDFKSMFQTAMKLVKTFQNLKLEKPRDIAEEVVKDLKQLKMSIPFIHCLCTDGMKERHWTQVYDMFGYDQSMRTFEPADNDGKSELKDVFSLDQIQQQLGIDETSPLSMIQEYTNKLDEVSDTAAKEWKNEKMFRQMKEEWGPAQFECKPEKSTYKLEAEAIELIEQLLDDHTVKTQTMKGSPYAKFLPEIFDWEADLIETTDNLDVWQSVQQVWLNLEPVFASEDIMNQMKNEG